MPGTSRTLDGPAEIGQPSDPKSNSIRTLVNRAAVVEWTTLPPGEANGPQRPHPRSG